jgi:hypothetical protein
MSGQPEPDQEQVQKSDFDKEKEFLVHFPIEFPHAGASSCR